MAGWLLLLLVVGAILALFIAYWWRTHWTIKARGVRTVGQVMAVRKRTVQGGYVAGGMYGSGGGFYTPDRTVYDVTYVFEAAGRTWGPFEKTGGREMRQGDQIVVYYLPKNPQKKPRRL